MARERIRFHPESRGRKADASPAPHHLKLTRFGKIEEPQCETTTSQGLSIYSCWMYILCEPLPRFTLFDTETL